MKNELATMLISPQKVKTYGVINLNVNESEIGRKSRAPRDPP